MPRVPKLFYNSMMSRIAKYVILSQVLHNVLQRMNRSPIDGLGSRLAGHARAMLNSAGLV
jgi:hypothetical protein